MFPLWKSIGTLFEQLMVLPNEIEINLKIIDREKDRCTKWKFLDKKYMNYNLFLIIKFDKLFPLWSMD